MNPRHLFAAWYIGGMYTDSDRLQSALECCGITIKNSTPKLVFTIAFLSYRTVQNASPVHSCYNSITSQHYCRLSVFCLPPEMTSYDRCSVFRKVCGISCFGFFLLTWELWFSSRFAVISSIRTSSYSPIQSPWHDVCVSTCRFSQNSN